MTERDIVTGRATVDEQYRPTLAPHIRFRFDERRQKWVVLAPERMLMPDDISVEILKRCGGSSLLAEIIDQLATEFDAPRAEIAADVIAMIQDLTDQGIVVHGS
jgi:pyrroloquinoline quinone biosynthesis protein D